MTKPLFDVVATYRRLLDEDPELTMPVAAIEALIMGLADQQATTAYETLDIVRNLTLKLKASVPNAISLSAGTDIFQQYLISNLNRAGGVKDFEEVRKFLLDNGQLFVERAKAARDRIAHFGRQLVHDGDVILTNGGSRVVGALLKAAAEESNNSVRGSIRYKVIYVVSEDDKGTESLENIRALRERDIPVATIPPTAVAFCMDQVSHCIVGAEGVLENGGIVSRMGTYQMGMLAKALNKPFYVAAESHKFVRVFPVTQHDLPIQQNILDFKADGDIVDEAKKVKDEAAKDPNADPSTYLADIESKEGVDYTPPNLIAAIVTETGVTMPAAVSERLIEMWW